MIMRLKYGFLVLLVLFTLIPLGANAAPPARQQACYTGNKTDWKNQGGEIHHYVQFNNVRSRLSNITVGIRNVPNPGQYLVSPWGYVNNTTFQAGFRYPNGVPRPPASLFWMCGYY